MITQDGRPALAPPRARVDSALVKALGRAFRWRRLLDTGAYAIKEKIATAEGINPSCVSRVLRLTVLAPSIVESILDGRQPEGITLAWSMGAWPGEWEGQRWGSLGGKQQTNLLSQRPDRRKPSARAPRAPLRQHLLGRDRRGSCVNHPGSAHTPFRLQYFTAGRDDLNGLRVACNLLP